MTDEQMAAIAKALGNLQADVVIALTAIASAVSKQPGIDRLKFKADLLSVLEDQQESVSMRLAKVLEETL